MDHYEYQVITLKGGGHDGHDYCWHSDCDGRIGPHGDLSYALNHRGANGWHVVAFSSDGRFGNTLVLQRKIVEPVTADSPSDASAVKETTVGPGISLLADEIAGLRQDLMASQAVYSDLIRALPGTMVPILQAIATQTAPQPPITVEAKIGADCFQGMERQLGHTLAEIRNAVLQMAALQSVEEEQSHLEESPKGRFGLERIFAGSFWSSLLNWRTSHAA